jgi:hypothetical protein
MIRETPNQGGRLNWVCDWTEARNSAVAALCRCRYKAFHEKALWHFIKADWVAVGVLPWVSGWNVNLVWYQRYFSYPVVAV